MLGSAQRQWLSRRLAASTAALTLVASGSVMLGSVGYNDPVLGYCSGDDWNVGLGVGWGGVGWVETPASELIRTMGANTGLLCRCVAQLVRPYGVLQALEGGNVACRMHLTWWCGLTGTVCGPSGAPRSSPPSLTTSAAHRILNPLPPPLLAPTPRPSIRSATSPRSSTCCTRWPTPPAAVWWCSQATSITETSR